MACFYFASLLIPFPSISLLPSFTLSPPLPLEVGPIKPARGSGERCKLSNRVPGRAPAENEFAVLYRAVRKPLGGNHLEYSEVHVLDQTSAEGCFGTSSPSVYVPALVPLPGFGARGHEPRRRD